MSKVPLLLKGITFYSLRPLFALGFPHKHPNHRRRMLEALSRAGIPA